MSEWFANTWYLWNRRKFVAPLVDLWEVGCRWELYPVISRESLPHLANSDFHRPEHLYAWKTLLNAEKSREGVLAALRRGTGHRRAAPDARRRRRHGMNARWPPSAWPGSRISAPGLRGRRRASCAGSAGRSGAQPVPGFAPPVSILKPLCGLDEGLEAEPRVLLPPATTRAYEIVFSFARAVRSGLSRSRGASPTATRGSPRRFVFDARESGGNAKVDRLVGGAADHARHRLVLFSDGNVRVRPDFLARAVSHFADPRVGLVSHLFRASGAAELASRIESLYLERMPAARNRRRLADCCGCRASWASPSSSRGRRSISPEDSRRCGTISPRTT